MPEQKRKKLDDRGEKCIFVRYDTKSKAYRLYNPLNKKVIISKDVEFNEKTTSAGQKKKNMLEACSSIIKITSYEK